MPYLEVKFSSGQVGRYPFSRNAAVRIKEPNDYPVVGTIIEGAEYAFSVADVQSISFNAGEIGPKEDAPAASGSSSGVSATVTPVDPAPEPEVPAEASDEAPAEEPPAAA